MRFHNIEKRPPSEENDGKKKNATLNDVFRSLFELFSTPGAGAFYVRYFSPCRTETVCKYHIYWQLL